MMFLSVLPAAQNRSIRRTPINFTYSLTPLEWAQAGPGINQLNLLDTYMPDAFLARDEPAPDL